MARQTVNIGSAPNDGTGDPLRVAYDKLNDNFLEIYDDGGVNITVNNPVTLTETTLDVALADLVGGGGAVDSVNTQTGVVELDLENILNYGNRRVNEIGTTTYNLVSSDKSKTLSSYTGETNITLNAATFDIGDEIEIVNPTNENLTFTSNLEFGVVFYLGVDIGWLGSIYLVAGSKTTIKCIEPNIFTLNIINDYINYPVTSVNSQSGDIVLNADNIGESSTRKWVSPTEKTTWNGKQDALVSGTNIKTINGNSVLGSGDVTIATATTLQQILDNNHDLTNGRNYQGTGAGVGATGTNQNAFGLNSANNSDATHLNALGSNAGFQAHGNNINGFGLSAANNNFGTNINAFGESAGGTNLYNNVNLFGFQATADLDNQTVFSKWVSGATKYLARLSFNNITANRKYELQDASGTLAFLSDITGGGATNLGYTPSPTDGTVTSDTGTDATLPLANVTNAGLLKPADFTQLSTLVSDLALKAPLASPALTGTPTAPSQSANDNSTKIATTAYTDAKVTDTITDGVTTIAPSQNAVFDALALKQAALSYTPYRNLQTSQTAFTGTTAETILFTATIPANTFNANDIIHFLYNVYKTTTLGTYVIRLKINTTNTLTGAATIGTYNGAATTQIALMNRNLHLNGGNLYGYPSVSLTLISDIVGSIGTIATNTLNPANQFFIFGTVTLANASDNIIGTMFKISN